MPHADLGTAAIILPWNDPLRIAEKVAMLDLLSNGRVRLGIGRGLARREFAAFRGTMDDSRERFDESSKMILDALRTGFIEGNGKFYPQPRIEIRPRPEKSFEGRTYAVASSEDSIDAAARLKARMLMFADRPWPLRLPGIQRYRELFAKYHGAAAPPVVTADQCVCAATSAEAEELAERHMASFVDSNLEHYELMNTHFETAKGYDAYAKKSRIARETGRDGLVKALLQVAVRGTPDQVLRAYEQRRALSGRLRTEQLVPLRRHPAGESRSLDAAVRERGAAGAKDLATGCGRRAGRCLTRAVSLSGSKYCVPDWDPRYAAAKAPTAGAGTAGISPGRSCHTRYLPR